MTRIFKSVLVLFALATVGIAPSAEAATIRLFDGTTTIDIQDNAGLDSDGDLGLIRFEAGDPNSGAIYTIELGATKPLVGSAASPAMFFSLFVMNAVGNFEISFSETGFSPISAVGRYGAFGMSDGIKYDVLLDPTNTLFGGPVIDSTTSTTNGFQFEKELPLFSTQPYSLTQRFSFTMDAQNPVKNVTFGALAVPDGGMTLSLFGLAVLGVEALRRKFRN